MPERLHVNVVPDNELVGLYAKAVELHTGGATNVDVRDGAGFSVTVTVSAAELAEAVEVTIWYVTTTELSVELVRISLISPVPVVEPGVTPATVARLQEYVAPGASLSGTNPMADPEQAAVINVFDNIPVYPIAKFPNPVTAFDVIVPDEASPVVAELP